MFSIVHLHVSPELGDLPVGLSQPLLQVALPILLGAQLLLVTPLQQPDFMHQSLQVHYDYQETKKESKSLRYRTGSLRYFHS